jgi:hypothetical protein
MQGVRTCTNYYVITWQIHHSLPAKQCVAVPRMTFDSSMSTMIAAGNVNAGGCSPYKYYHPEVTELSTNKQHNLS